MYGHADVLAASQPLDTTVTRAFALTYLLLIAGLPTSVASAQAPAAPARAPSVLNEGDLTDEERSYVTEAVDAKPLGLDFNVRFGASAHAMSDSLQGRPLAYPTLGLRKKSATFYFDAHLTILMTLIDGLIFVVQEEILDVQDSFSTMGTVNEPRHYVFGEAAHIRLGPTTTFTFDSRIRANTTHLVRLSGGVVGLADWVVFDATRQTDALGEDQDIGDIIVQDPVVIGAGVFGAIGGWRDPFSYDLALEVGYDLVNWGGFTPSRGWIFALDGDIQVDLVDNAGLYGRARISAYTHLPDSLTYTFALSTGVSMRF